MKHQKTRQKTRLELLSEFYASPDETLFGQATLCAVLDCSIGLAERNRWAGKGVPFIKFGRAVRYRKCDILDFIKRNSSKISSKVVQLKNINICNK